MMKIKSSLLLLGLVLAVPAALAGNGAGGPQDPAGPGGPDDSGTLIARSLLELAETPSDGDAWGRVEILSTTGSGRERFRVLVGRLDADAVVSVTMDDGASGILDLGDITADGDGQAILELDTGDDDSLPGNVSQISDLAGRWIEILDADDAVLLFGDVPSFEDTERPWRVKATIQEQAQTQEHEGDCVQARVKLKQQKQDKQKLKLKATGLEPNESCELRVEYPDGGEMRHVLQLQANHRGRVKIKLKTKGDEELLPGCGGAKDLAGLRFEIRNRNQECVLQGAFPTP